MAILITGGAGFIGSHVCVELLSQGRDVVVVDNFSNSSPAALAAVRELAPGRLTLHEADIRDPPALDKAFADHDIESVVHLAGMKAVQESLQIPLEYFDVNVAGTTSLLQAMAAHGVLRLVFSSSCSIFGSQYSRPIREDDVPGPTNPYARSKLICEQIMADACARFDELAVISLRYFNPTGAHPSGLLGEAPRGLPTNLMPYMLQVAAGQRPRLQVFGGDYPTPDGSAVRDYIHVQDLARAHRLAVERLGDGPGLRTLNLGTGDGVSVLGLIGSFEQSCGLRVPFEVVPRRDGDAATAVADPSRVEAEWGWRTSLDVHAMCRDAWHFHQRHPLGYDGPASPLPWQAAAGRR